MCWYRNIMVHKCYCATKQIWHSKYTARNQTICFKRTQELLKLSWNISGEKAAATLISKAGWHCSSATRSPVVLYRLYYIQPACITRQWCFQRGGKFPSVIPKASARWSWTWEKKFTKLVGFNLLFIENWSPVPRSYQCSTLFLDCALIQNEIEA